MRANVMFRLSIEYYYRFYNLRNTVNIQWCSVFVVLIYSCIVSQSAIAYEVDSAAAQNIQTCYQTGKDTIDRCRLKAEINKLKKIQSRVENSILALPGVMGFGIGRSNNELHFIAIVDRSKPIAKLPKKVAGILVVAKPRDPVRLLHGFPICGDTSPCHVDQLSLPVEMGNSGGGINTTVSGACSLGFKACDLGTGKVVFVTNSHCNQSLSTCNLTTPGSSSVWIHPGRLDVTQNAGNCTAAGTCSIIGDITAHAAPSCNSNNNFTDATKVESSTAKTSNAFRDIGFAQAAPGVPLIGDPVRKSSRTTGDTTGEITCVNVTYSVPGPSENGFCCGPLMMKGQIEWRSTGRVLQGGDSGSALLSLEPEGEFRVVGLNWGTDGTFNYANHIDDVLAALNLSLNFVSCFQDCVFSAAANTAKSMVNGEQGLLELGHRFREQVLAKSVIGRKYTQMYYQFSDEAITLTKQSPKLMKQTVRLLIKFTPKLKELVINGLEFRVSAEKKHEKNSH